jgi:phosphoglucosamine mutase
MEKSLSDSGIGFVRAKVGDRFVHQALHEGGGVLGGEASGHLLCLDRSGTGDAIVAALQVLEALNARNASLKQATSDYQPLPQKTVNVRITAGAKPLESANVQNARKEAEAALQGAGRLVLRASGTEPLIRVTVEAGDAALMQSVLDKLADAVRAAV